MDALIRGRTEDLRRTVDGIGNSRVDAAGVDDRLVLDVLALAGVGLSAGQRQSPPLATRLNFATANDNLSCYRPSTDNASAPLVPTRFFSPRPPRHVSAQEASREVWASAGQRRTDRLGRHVQIGLDK